VDEGTTVEQVPVIGSVTVHKYSKAAEIETVAVGSDVTLYKISGDECGESTLDAKYESAAISFAGLKEGTCASQGYTVDEGTTVEQVPVIGSVTVHKYSKAAEIETVAVGSDVTLYKISGDECGESTLDAKYESAAISFAGLKKGTCAAEGYTVDDGTTNEKVPVIGSVTVHKFKKSVGLEAVATPVCPPEQFTTAKDFDLKSYAAARWYVQQQMPVQYLPETQNYCVQARYTLRESRTLLGYDVDVHNYAEEKDGTVHSATLCAKIVDADSGKLEVAPCFLPSIFAGPYWVLDYSEQEGYALISGGAPTEATEAACKTGDGVNGAGLWIFTRKQQRDQDLLEKVRNIAVAKGFDVSVLKDVDQTNCKGDPVVV